jgi:hypothetical protein
MKDRAMSQSHTPPVLDPIKKAARKIRASWTERERSFRRSLAQLRAQAILQMIENSAVAAH